MNTTVGLFHQRMYSTDRFGQSQEPMAGDKMFQVGYYGLAVLVGSFYAMFAVALIYSAIV